MTSPLELVPMYGSGKHPRQGERLWTFRNSRTLVKLVFENLEDGMTIDEIIEQYPVSREEIKAVRLRGPQPRYARP